MAMSAGGSGLHNEYGCRSRRELIQPRTLSNNPEVPALATGFGRGRSRFEVSDSCPTVNPALRRIDNRSSNPSTSMKATSEARPAPDQPAPRRNGICRLLGHDLVGSSSLSSPGSPSKPPPTSAPLRSALGAESESSPYGRWRLFSPLVHCSAGRLPSTSISNSASWSQSRPTKMLAFVYHALTGHELGLWTAIGRRLAELLAFGAVLPRRGRRRKMSLTWTYTARLEGLEPPTF